MIKKLFSLLSLIPLIGGIALGISGINKVKEAKSMVIPAMGESNWFDMSTKQSKLEMSGIACIIFGFVFIALMGTLVILAISFAKKKTDEFTKRAKDLTNNDDKNSTPFGNLFDSLKNLSENNKETTCKYCGGVIPEGKTNCPSCGARVNKK